MISREEVIALAALARLELPTAEVEKLRRDLESILGYVAGLKVETSALSAASQTRMLSDNALRGDDHPHPTGAFTERLLAMSPEHRDGYLVVKSIFTDHGH